MAISPDMNESKARAIRQLYEDAESVILEKMARTLGANMDSESWQAIKLVQLRKLLADLSVTINELNQKSPQELKRIVNESYQAGINSADSDLAKIHIDVNANGMTYGNINTKAVEALVTQKIHILEASHMQIFRRVDDAYRSIIAEVAGNVTTGVDTRRQAAQKALSKFADRGIGTFVDTAGRQWDLASYAEMATRSASGQASIQGHADRMQEHGRDLVIVSDHPEECPRCRPWERKILSVSGLDDRYPALSTARADGLFHPGCGHTINAYIDGLTEVGTPEADPEGYEQRQYQRHLERQIRFWKRRQSVALDDVEKAKTTAKVKEWQGKMKDFIDETERKRKRWRESITQAR